MIFRGQKSIEFLLFSPCLCLDCQIRIAFVRNVPPSADEDYLKKLFQPFGNVLYLAVSFWCFADYSRCIKNSKNRTLWWHLPYMWLISQVEKVALSRKGSSTIGFVYFDKRSVSFAAVIVSMSLTLILGALLLLQLLISTNLPPSNFVESYLLLFLSPGNL